jgi:hypothetical protein
MENLQVPESKKKNKKKFFTIVFGVCQKLEKHI